MAASEGCGASYSYENNYWKTADGVEFLQGPSAEGTGRDYDRLGNARRRGEKGFEDPFDDEAQLAESTKAYEERQRVRAEERAQRKAERAEQDRQRAAKRAARHGGGGGGGGHGHGGRGYGEEEHKDGGGSVHSGQRAGSPDFGPSPQLVRSRLRQAARRGNAQAGVAGAEDDEFYPGTNTASGSLAPYHQRNLPPREYDIYGKRRGRKVVVPSCRIHDVPCAPNAAYLAVEGDTRRTLNTASTGVLPVEVAAGLHEELNPLQGGGEHDGGGPGGNTFGASSLSFLSGSPQGALGGGPAMFAPDGTGSAAASVTTLSRMEQLAAERENNISPVAAKRQQWGATERAAAVEGRHVFEVTGCPGCVRFGSLRAGGSYACPFFLLNAGHHKYRFRVAGVEDARGAGVTGDPGLNRDVEGSVKARKPTFLPKCVLA